MKGFVRLKIMAVQADLISLDAAVGDADRSVRVPGR